MTKKGFHCLSILNNRYLAKSKNSLNHISYLHSFAIKTCVCCIYYSVCLCVRSSVPLITLTTFFYILLYNHWAYSNQTLQNASLDEDDSILYNEGACLLQREIIKII